MDKFKDGMFAGPIRFRLTDDGRKVPHTVRIDGDGTRPTRIYLDGKEVHVMAVDFHMEAGEMPLVRLTFFSQLEIPGGLNIEPMELSLDVLRNAIHHEPIYKAD